MKTFTHSVNGTDYTIRITGTVGLQIMAQTIVPEEADRYTTATVPVDTTTVPDASPSGSEVRTIPTAKWLMALLYSAFITSNPKAQDTIDFMQFMMSFSTKEFNAAVIWYYEAYAEREGILPSPVPSDSPEGEDSDSKNA